MAVAEEDDILNIKIPEGLRPNYVSFLFYFDAKSHTLVFEQHLSGLNVSPNSVYKLFDALASDESIMREYGTVAITLMQDRERLEDVFNIFRIRQIHIVVKRPNPDDLGSYDEDVQRRLGNMNVDTLEVVLKGNRSASVKPDKETLALAELATRNGVAEARGVDVNGAPQAKSTKSHPLFKPYWFHSDHPTLGKVDMARAAQVLIEFVTGRST